MDLRILMVGDDPSYILPDIQLLRDKGFRVYTVFNNVNINDVFEETKPHIVFFNFTELKKSGKQHIKLTNSILKQRTSIIYSIKEDDTYMVVQYKDAVNKKHVTLADNLIAAVKTALGNVEYTSKITLESISQSIHLHTIR